MSRCSARGKPAIVKTELADARTELEDARAELRALRTEEQRAAMLEDELRAARAELDSAHASHRAELIEREADLEEKVRTIREEFQDQLEATEARHRDELAAQGPRPDQRVASVESPQRPTRGAATRSRRSDRPLRRRRAGDRDGQRSGPAAGRRARRGTQRARPGPHRIEGHEAEIARLAEASATAERQAAEAAARATKLAADLEDATQETPTSTAASRRSRRGGAGAAAAEGRAHIDELLRVTQERLAGQTEKLIAAEERVHELERDLSATARAAR